MRPALLTFHTVRPRAGQPCRDTTSTLPDLGRAARQLQLNVAPISNGKAADLLKRLPQGRIHANGRHFLPSVRKDLYERVVAFAGLRGYWDRSSAARAFPRDPLNVALRDADISKLEVVQAVQLTKTFIVSIAFAGTIDHASRQRCCERDDDRANSVNGRRCLFTSLFGRLHRSRLLLRHFLQGAAIFERHHFAELGQIGAPILEDMRGAARSRKLRMARDQEIEPPRVEAAHVAHHLDPAMSAEIAGMVVVARIDVLFVGHRLDIHHRHVAAAAETAVFIEHIGDAARHPGGEVAAGVAEHNHDAAGHVLAAMVARALDHRDRPGVANGEALAGDAAEIATGRRRSALVGRATPSPQAPAARPRACNSSTSRTARFTGVGTPAVAFFWTPQ